MSTAVGEQGFHGDALVIGAGLAGLTAAWTLASRGKKVRLVTKGWGATHWHAGCIDVLGYFPLDNGRPVDSPLSALPDLMAAEPNHPYALLGIDRLDEALSAFQALCSAAGYPLSGSLDQNWLLPSAVGTFRPTCLAPEMMTAGDLGQDEPMLIVGFQSLLDFYPGLVAANLEKQGIAADHATLDLPSLRERNFVTPLILAHLFEQEAFRAEVAAALKPHLGRAGRVGFPAVLGIERAQEVRRSMETALDRPVFEIPGLPPSVPGMRLHRILIAAIEANGGRVFEGMEALAGESEGDRVVSVQTEAAARRRRHIFDRTILATGGILGGGLQADHQGKVKEMVFDLPVRAPASRQDWFEREFLAPRGHPIYRAGLEVDAQFRPLNSDGRPVYANLFAAGTTLAGGEYIRERSFEGVAFSTGYAVGSMLGG